MVTWKQTSTHSGLQIQMGERDQLCSKSIHIPDFVINDTVAHILPKWGGGAPLPLWLQYFNDGICSYMIHHKCVRQRREATVMRYTGVRPLECLNIRHTHTLTLNLPLLTLLAINLTEIISSCRCRIWMLHFNEGARGWKWDMDVRRQADALRGYCLQCRTSPLLY
jgi:hypothetical protein